MMELQLNSQDKEIIKTAKEGRFREMIKAYIEDQKETLRDGILSGVNEEMSKPKYNDRDVLLLTMQFIDDVLNIPDNILMLISNQTDISEE